MDLHFIGLLINFINKPIDFNYQLKYNKYIRS